MRKYKCNECEKISSEKEWNESTQKEFVSKIVPLDKNIDIYSYSFICPKCHERNDAYMMEKQ